MREGKVDCVIVGSDRTAANGDVVHTHNVEVGDIWRAASTKEAPIRDWVNLAIDRQRAEGCRAIFWLDATRAHDSQLIAYVKPILEAKGVADKFEIMAPREATRASFETITKGENAIGHQSDRASRTAASAGYPDGEAVASVSLVDFIASFATSRSYASVDIDVSRGGN